MSSSDAGRRIPRPLPGATVLQIVPSLADDLLGRGAVDVAWALLRAGARAIVAADTGPLAAELKAFGGEWIEFPSASANPFRLVRNRRELAGIISRERIDIVHASGVGGTLSAAEVGTATAARLITTYSGQVGRRDDAAYVRALARCERIITHSGYVADLLIDRDQFPRERFAIVPPRVDTTWFDPAAVSVERVKTLRQEWQIRRGERIVLVPGRIDPAKGQLSMIDAVRTLITGGMQHVVFVLAGDEQRNPGYVRAVRSAVIAQGLEPSFRLVGLCPDMPAAYAAADFVAVPVAEPPGFARTVAEALAMGRPVVATAIGSLPEIVLTPPLVSEDSRTGWLADPSDPMALPRAIATAASLDLAALRVLGARARKLAVLLFAPERVAAAVLGVYSTLLAGEA
jgi:glycosyltransferase involved in cell wall biosynthesis